MRRVSCDQDEFQPPDSEQSLELAISSPSRRHPELRSLLLECGASASGGPPLPPDWPRWAEIADHLHRFAGITPPPPSRCRDVVVLRDDWDDLELGLAFDSVLIWYHWSTSA